MNVFTASVKVFLLSCLPLLVQAEDAVKPAVGPDPMASAGKVAGFLVLVVAMIFLLAWMVNKTRAGQWAGNSGHLKTLAVLPLGTKEKIAVIQVGDQQLVVGITPQQITTLATLETPLTMEERAPASFADVLKMAIQK